MSKITRKGYVKISGLKDLLLQLENFPEIDTVKYSYQKLPPKAVYVALWSSTTQQGFGGVIIPEDGLKIIQQRFGDQISFKRIS